MSVDISDLIYVPTYKDFNKIPKKGSKKDERGEHQYFFFFFYKIFSYFYKVIYFYYFPLALLPLVYFVGK